MKTKFFLALAAACCVLSACSRKEVRIHTIGDSTMADYAENTTRARGWGEMFQEFFTDDAIVINYARNGRSTRSFMSEGLWDKVKAAVQPGDYVLIQFAHNDEKGNGTYSDDGRGTDPWGHYKANLETYVNETRALGATPILITPIVRRYYTADGTISPKGCHNLGAAGDTTLDYVYVMKQVAREMQVPLIDHTALTKAFIEELGEQQTTDLIYAPTDGTHTQATGAALYARMVAQALQQAGILTEYVRPDVPIVLNPDTLNFGQMYVGDEACMRFDLTGLALPEREGEIVVTAPKGMTVASAPDAQRQESVALAYTDGKLWNQCCYLYFTPEQAGTINDAVTVVCGKVKREIPVVAESRVITLETPEKAEIGKYTLKGLDENETGIAIAGGKWPADIDEAGDRYVEFVFKGNKKTFLVRQITFTLDGGVAYRAALSKSNDFYPRTILGENQRPESGVRTITLPTNTTVKPGERLAVRIYPWSVAESDNLRFRIADFVIDGIAVE